MAVLSKIREKSVFLMVIIALALFAFVIQGAFKYKKSNNLVGEVDGDPITREQFAKEVELYKTQRGGKATQIQAAKNVWNSIVQERIYKLQLENAGIVVGEEDVWNAILSLPYIANSPLFKNEAGLFDVEKFKEFLVTLKENADNNPNDTQWAGWLRTEKGVKSNLEQSIYTGLVKNGISTTLNEGKNFFLNQSTKSDIEYVYVPFRTVPDSLFKVTDDEVLAFEKKHKREFKVEASRDLLYVNFEINPTKDDEAVLKKEMTGFINDKEEYSSAAKATIKINGFKNTNDYKAFFAENNSDIPYSEEFLVKSKLPILAADNIIKAKKGDVIGPYKDKEFYKLTKVLDFKKIPDSVKASHILISFKGALRSNDLKTEEQAKKMADSLYKLVRYNKKKFAEVAKTLSYDKGSGAKGGDLNWFVYNSMVPEFRDFAFLNKKGKVGVVKSRFGYHIIRIDDQKNHQKAYKVVTFGKKIEASEETENNIFEQAETFTSQVTKSKDFRKQARKDGYIVRPVTGVKILNETLLGLKNQRSIINWAFKKDTKVGDVKRFDTDNGYAVVQVTGNYKKGLMSVRRAGIRVKRLLFNKKKADYIRNLMGNMSLKEISTKFKIPIKTSLAVSLASPAIPIAGKSLELVGAINASKKGDIIRGVAGKAGAFAVKIIRREDPIDLPNYDSFRNQIFSKLQLSSFLMYNALEKEAEIVDNRSLYY
ncbi:MAG: peptidylprolyl isomerase [Flavobacteriaceae bacterium]